METATAVATEQLSALVLQENLARALECVRSAVDSRRYALPVLESVKLATEYGRLTVTATNLDLTIKVFTGAMINGEGAAVIPYRQLRDSIKASPAATVGIKATGKLQTEIECARATLSLKSYNPEDFPRIPMVPETPGVTFGGQDFARALAYVEDAVAKDDSRPVLTGVLLSVVNARIATLSAADGFVRAYRELPISGGVENGEYIIPLAAMQTVAKLAMLDKRRPAEICFTPGDRGTGANVSRTNVHFAIGYCDIEVTAQTITGTFPSISALRTDAAEPTFTVNRDALKTMVTRAGIIAREGSGIIRLYPGVDASGVTILRARASADEVGQFDCAIDATGTTSATRVAIQMKYLKMVLDAMPDVVALGIKSQETPILFASPDGYWLVMPMFVTWDKEDAS